MKGRGWKLCAPRKGTGKTLDGNEQGVYFSKGRLLGSTAPGTADA
jgi:hypothetical protein